MKLTPETVNQWRIVPRLMTLLYGFMCYRIGEWFMALPDPSNPQGFFVSVVFGAAAVWFNLYVNSGPKPPSE